MLSFAFKFQLIGIKLVENRLQPYGNNHKFFTLFVDTDKFLLSSDYIGASVYWAVKAGLSEDEIVDFLRISRTLGGHIVFCVDRYNGGSTMEQLDLKTTRAIIDNIEKIM